MTKMRRYSWFGQDYAVPFAFCWLLSFTGTATTTIYSLTYSFTHLRTHSLTNVLIHLSSDTDHIDETDRNRFFFFTGGLACLTLVFNGCSCEYVLNKLELIGEQSRDRDIILTLIKKKVVIKAKESMYKFLDKFKYELNEIHQVLNCPPIYAFLIQYSLEERRNQHGVCGVH